MEHRVHRLRRILHRRRVQSYLSSTTLVTAGEPYNEHIFVRACSPATQIWNRGNDALLRSCCVRGMQNEFAHTWKPADAPRGRRIGSRKGRTSGADVCNAQCIAFKLTESVLTAASNKVIECSSPGASNFLQL